MHTQNFGIIRTLQYSELETCSEPDIFRTLPNIYGGAMERFGKEVNGHNYFRNISFSRSLLLDIPTFLITSLIFIPKEYQM